METKERIRKKVVNNFFGKITNYYEAPVTYNAPVYNNEVRQNATTTERTAQAAKRTVNITGRPMADELASCFKKEVDAVAAVVEKARASGATRDKNWWFCIYAPMAELNNNENSKSCFWDSDERGEYKAFFVLMHQWLEEDTKDFIDEAWTKSFSSEKKTWKRVGMLDRCERNRTLTPHECWADYALKKRLKQWNEKQARKARTAYELWLALKSCVNSDNVISGT